MSIDALEAIIVWLADELSDVSGRVAAKHRYGSGWGEHDAGVSIRMDGGSPDIYAPLTRARLEVLIYGEQTQIMETYSALLGLSRDNARFVVTTSNGDALVHYFLPQSVLSFLYNDELNMDMGLVFFEAMVSESQIGD